MSASSRCVPGCQTRHRSPSQSITCRWDRFTRLIHDRRIDAEVEVGADHGAQEFDRAFLHRVGGRAEPSGEIAVEAMLGARSVTAFVEQHCVVGNRIPEAGERGHLHVVLRWNVAGLRYAMANIDTKDGAESLSMFYPLSNRKHRHLERCVPVSVERRHGQAFSEGTDDNELA